MAAKKVRREAFLATPSTMEIRAYQRSAAIEESDLVVKKRKNYYADLVFPTTYLVPHGDFNLHTTLYTQYSDVQT